MRPRVHVFVPYIEANGALSSPYHDPPEVRADVGTWMDALGLSWEWVPITLGNVEEMVSEARAPSVVVLNLCDGDEVNGYPGLSVVKALERAGIPFTGARSPFYATSTSKLAMKSLFAAAGVNTAPWIVIDEPERDVIRAGRSLGFPLFIKPDVSFGSAGITVRSLVTNGARALDVIQSLLAGMHGLHFERGAIYAEPFLGGREFTVLLVSDTVAQDGITALVPCERVFDVSLPQTERFLTFERICGEYERDKPLEEGVTFYKYAKAPEELRQPLTALAKQAFRAVGGNGYARVDIRTHEVTGEPFVLEVNANCALSSDDTSSVGSILALSRVPITHLIDIILRDALVRHRRLEPAR